MNNNLEGRTDSLSPAKQALIEKLKAAKVGLNTAGQGQKIPKRLDPQKPSALSFAQQRLWFLDQLEGPSATYNMPSAIELIGPLNIRALEKVFTELCNRHESLRTNFINIDGEPFQIIRNKFNIEIPNINLENLNEDLQKSEYEKIAREFSQTTFNLENEKLFRVKLIRLNEHRHIVLLVIHHIISDGWSNGNVMLREICTLYESFSNNQESPLEDLPIQYADFAQWQRTALDGPYLEKQIDYWKERLHGIPALLELPLDYSRPAKQTYSGKTIYFEIDQEKLQSLKALGKSLGASLFMVLQAIFSALLYRHTNQEIIVVGSPIANRNTKEVEDLIGFFVNTLAFRMDLNPHVTCIEAIHQARENFLRDYQHQDLPFERLVEAIRPERNPSFSPLFQVMLILQNQNEERSGLKIGDLSLSAMPLAPETSMFDLTLKFEEQESKLLGELEYNTDLFSSQTIYRLVERLQNMLLGFISNPEQSIAEVPLLNHSEREQILREFNKTERSYPQTETICTLFEKQASINPDRIAIWFEDQQISYGELNQRAAKLAAHLNRNGIGTDSLVGLCLERSIDLIIGILGILKAGGAYVPIDPAYPPNRIQEMISSAQIQLILAQKSTAPLLGVDENNLIYLDAEWHKIELLSAAKYLISPPEQQMDKLAYVIFTSGSTGKPKGVQISHRALENFLQTMLEAPGLTEKDSLLAITTISFDIAALELYLPLISGARIILASKEAASDGFELSNLLLSSQANVMQATPATWRLLLSAVEAKSLPLEKLLCGGEALNADLTSKLLQANAQLWNVYGPTETTVWSTRNLIKQTSSRSYSNPTIGTPIANTQIFITDPNNEVTPIGVTGNLYIGGAGLSRGYLNQPALTAERFIPAAFSTKPGERIYETGDVARFNSDGEIEYIGRADFQVKIRGFRIELGEIESVLTQHPAIRNAVAVCQESANGSATLNAFIEPNEGWESLLANPAQDSEILNKWQTVWDKTYEIDSSATQGDLDLDGWISSYTGKPIPKLEMEAWINETTQNILALQPVNVLEIGCGSGLLLLRIAPHVRSYAGLDFSKSILDRLQKRIQNQGLLNTQLICKKANQIQADEIEAVDTVIINSVSQYFPNIDYLIEVLACAIKVVANGGQIFVGDIRAKCMLELQTFSTMAFQADAKANISALSQKLASRIHAEEELLLDPQFFVLLKARFTEIQGLTFNLKKDVNPNEMNKFRYDLVIHIDRTQPQKNNPVSCKTIYSNREKSPKTVEELSHLLSTQTEPLLIKNITNARLVDDSNLLGMIEKPDLTLGQAIALLPTHDGCTFDPSDLHEVAKSLDLSVCIVWSSSNPAKWIDALFFKNSANSSLIGVENYLFNTDELSRNHSIDEFANNPVGASKLRALIAELYEAIHAQLPAYMAPSNIQYLDKLPLTPNGKIDRKALPKMTGATISEQYIAPRTQSEQDLYEIWSSLLNVKQFGINDNFFNLGGHSLLAVQVTTQIRDHFSIEISIQAIFDHPTIALLAAFIHSGSNSIRKLSPPIIAHSFEQRRVSPLSFSQQRLWFLDQLEGPSANYHISIAVEILGSLNADLLESALLQVIQRHEVLRTIYTETEGLASAVIVDTPSHLLKRHHLSEPSPSAQEVQNWLQKENSIPFQLSQDLPIRASLLRIGENHHALSITFHHIASDEWSMIIFQQELIALYESGLRGESAKLPELPVQYADYSQWQKRWLTEDVLSSQVHYWKHQLDSAPAVLNLPFDNPRPALQSHRGKTFEFLVDAELNSRLKTLNLATETTQFMGLFACYAALLAKYSNSNDLVIGTPVTHRNRSELTNLIGFFVNTLPIRFTLDSQIPTIALLSMVRKTMLDGFANQDIPFESIVEAIQPERSLSHAPIFQTMFVLMNASDEAIKSSGIQMLPLNAEVTTAKFDLTLSIEEISGALHATFEYNSDLFEEATIEKFSNHFIRMLQAMVEDPYAPILQTQLLDTREQQEILLDLNPKNHSNEFLFTEKLIEIQADTRPDAIAISALNQSLSYSELNVYANKLAYALKEKGVGPEIVVGLYFEPTVEMVISMLAILKAGGTYLPILPGTPNDRALFMLKEADAKLVLYSNANPPTFSGSWQSFAIENIALDDYSSLNPSATIPPDSKAYVIYTSGSTGNPKGVAVTRLNLAAYLNSRMTFYSEKVSGLLLLQPYGFDIATGNIFWTLTQGGTLFLAPHNLAGDPKALIDRIAETQISHLVLLPLLYRSVLTLASSQNFSSVEHVILGGESLHPDLVTEHYHKLSNTKLTNEYGPTETTIMCTAYTVPVDSVASRVPIGKPTCNGSIYLLDPTQKLALPRIGGEMYIGGTQVTRGYINQPALTAEKFIPSQFSQEPGGRLYRSGDHARYDKAGNIIFVGREDSQVKVRGFRIELAEIENAFLKISGIKDICVIVTGTDRLAKIYAYVVLQENIDLDKQAIIQLLQHELPDYMLPAGMHFLSAIPFTANGKIDHKSLPTPVFESASELYQAPRNEIEKALCHIWEEVLGQDRVGINDNFFNLGGDSILSIQIVSRLNQQGIFITVKQLFQQQTIAQLASVAQSKHAILAPQEKLSGAYALSPIQHWFFNHFQTETNHFNQSVNIEIDKSISQETLQKSFEFLIEHHDLLRSTFEFNKLSPSSSTANILFDSRFDGVQVLDVSQLIEPEKNERIRLFIDQLQSSLNISSGPLIRAALIKTEEDQNNRLFIVIHHLVVDGISWRILLNDLETLLIQINQDESLLLPPKTSSFGQWTDALVEFAGSNDATKDERFWESQRVSKENAQFPTDFTYDIHSNTLASSCHYEIRLEKALTEALLHEVPKAYRTQINDVLLAALASSLGKQTSINEFVITLEGHGREELFEHIDISRTVGWFTSSFPVRLSYLENEDIGSRILRIKGHLREIPKNGITYGILRYLNQAHISEDFGTPANFSPVSFNYLGQFDQTSQGIYLLTESSGYSGSDIGKRGQRQALIDINSRISGGQFVLNVSYSNNLYRPETIQSFCNLYLKELTEIIEHCKSGQYGAYSHNDFPLAKLIDEDYQKLFNSYALNIEDIYPLSPMQEGMVFHSRYTTASGAYIIQMSCDMVGDFNPELFQNAWQKVLNRHPSLRSAIFTDTQSHEYQIVLQDPSVEWQILDWSKSNPDSEHASWSDLVNQDRHLDYRLDEPALMRFYLVKNNRQWKFLWSHHHVLTDGWCLPILLREVLHFYCNKSENELPQPQPYRNYIQWLSLQDIETAKNYWKEYLLGFDAPTPLGILSPVIARTSESTSIYTEVDHLLSNELSDALHHFAKHHRLTLSNIMQGAWARLLSIYSQQNDVVFGATVSGRPAELQGVEDMVGLFINTLPVRAQFESPQTIFEFLSKLLADQMESDHFSYTPLVTIHNCSAVPPRLPLFDSILVFENYPLDSTIDEQAHALSIQNLQVHEQTNFPITITASGGKQIPIRIAFDQSLITLNKIKQLLNHYQNLLSYAVNNPNASIFEWANHVLSSHEIQRLTYEFNDTNLSIAEEDATVSSLFERQVRSYPDKTAVSMGDTHLTFDELNKRANQFARLLISLGAKPGSLIGICLERSPLLIIALLGVQKIGAAYVPIDPNYPDMRIDYMLEDSGAAILLKDSSNITARDKQNLHHQVIAFDLTTLEPFSTNALDISLSPLLPAYVIYTSGSTGNPKGVEISQKALVNFLLSMRDRPGIRSTDRLLTVTTISFDIAGLEIYLPLITGAQIIMVDKETSSDGIQLLKALHTHAATIMQATPITWRLLLEAGWDGTCLEQIWCGGEAFPVDLASSLSKTDAHVWNLYGPTETTIWSTRFLLPRLETIGSQIAIGRPIGNTYVYILDQFDNLIPEGIAGELFIGGDGVANGYLNRPSLTAQKFLPDPYSSKHGARLYATGDIARYEQDQNLICLGRVDHQIKLRGFRIEPGEIESVLLRNPTIKQAVIKVIEFSKDDQRLVAYLTIDHSEDSKAESIKSWLGTHLPPHMIPSEWVILESFPLTPNGKLDKSALPHPGQKNAEDFVSPSSDTEIRVSRLMAEVLTLEKVSIIADFFDLGGHSLLATKLMNRIQQTFGLNIPLSIFFEKSTIKQLSEHIDNLLWTTQSQRNISTSFDDDEEEFKL